MMEDYEVKIAVKVEVLILVFQKIIIMRFN